MHRDSNTNTPWRRAGSLFTAALLTAYLLRWDFAQAGAYANMIVAYSSAGTVAEAVRDTFSGEKPCSMCVELSEERLGLDNDDGIAPPSVPRPDLFPPSTASGCRPGFRRGTTRLLPVDVANRPPSKPPVPPPRPFSC